MLAFCTFCGLALAELCVMKLPLKAIIAWTLYLAKIRIFSIFSRDLSKDFFFTETGIGDWGFSRRQTVVPISSNSTLSLSCKIGRNFLHSLYLAKLVEIFFSLYFAKLVEIFYSLSFAKLVDIFYSLSFAKLVEIFFSLSFPKLVLIF